jgi:nitroimidazol reductase NimA-like FMN-containing flavoprotein (pyridoxamine 5'-phosphate oxidase superfamily)
MHARLTQKEKRYLDRARVTRVSSTDGRGQPHVAPLCHAFDSSRRTAYVATGGRTSRNLRRRPAAAIECDDYFED